LSNNDKTKQVEAEWKGAVDWFYVDNEIKTIELKKLSELWKKALPLTEDELYLIQQITWLSRCNWNLEPSIQTIILAIGKEERADLRIGHNYSITEERWKKAWAYYFSLKKWLPTLGKFTGLSVMLEYSDPEKIVQTHIEELLGKHTKMKELYVELFCYFLEKQLMGRNPEDSVKKLASKEAVKALNEEVKKHDYDKLILAAVQINPEEFSEGKLSWYEVCHHKFFRRCDITLSSIGQNQWRGTFKENSSEREEIEELLLRYSLAIESWIMSKSVNDKFMNDKHGLLRNQTDKKMFQVSLLNAFLKGQMKSI